MNTEPARLFAAAGRSLRAATLRNFAANFLCFNRALYFYICLTHSRSLLILLLPFLLVLVLRRRAAANWKILFLEGFLLVLVLYRNHFFRQFSRFSWSNHFQFCSLLVFVRILLNFICTTATLECKFSTRPTLCLHLLQKALYLRRRSSKNSQRRTEETDSEDNFLKTTLKILGWGEKSTRLHLLTTTAIALHEGWGYENVSTLRDRG